VPDEVILHAKQAFNQLVLLQQVNGDARVDATIVLNGGIQLCRDAGVSHAGFADDAGTTGRSALDRFLSLYWPASPIISDGRRPSVCGGLHRAF